AVKTLQNAAKRRQNSFTSSYIPSQNLYSPDIQGAQPRFVQLWRSSMATVDPSDLKPVEAGQRCRVGPPAVVRWMRRGVLLRDGSRLFMKHICVPGGSRFRPEWLDEFLAAIAADRMSDHAVPAQSSPKPPAKSARIERMRGELRAAGFIKQCT